MTYQKYPTAFAAITDVRDVLNWEASGHSSNYFGYFYGYSVASNLTETTFENDVQSDLYTSHEPVIISVNDSYLPDWINSHGTSHYVTVLGYNFNNGTMTYDETCGQVSCNTEGPGVYTTSISNLWSAIVNDNGNGGLVW